MAEQEIKVNINGDTSGLDNALSKGQANLARFAKVGAAAIAATGVAMIGLTKSSLANVDVLTKQARTLGLTTSAFQKMTLVAGEAGIESGKLSSMLGLMQRNIVELQQGTKLQTESFGRLGLSIKDLQGLSPDEQFAKIAASLDAVKDPAEKTALAMEVFGRSGKDAINMLSDYSAKAANAAKFQNEFGIAVSQFDAETIEAANDAMGRLGMIVTGVGNIIAANVAPALVALSNGFIELVGTGSRFRDVMGFIGENLDVMANSVGVLAVAMTAKAIPAIYAMVTGTGFLTGAMTLLSRVPVVLMFTGLVLGAGYLITKFMDLVENVGGFGNALTLMGGVAKAVFSGIGTSASALVPAMNAVWESVKAGFYSMLQGLTEKWAGFLSTMGAGYSDMPSWIPGANALGKALTGQAGEAITTMSKLDAAATAATSSAAKLKEEAAAIAGSGVDEAAAAWTRLNDAISGRTGMTYGGSGLGDGSLLPPKPGDAPSSDGTDTGGVTGGGGGGGGGGGAVKGAAGIASDMASRLEALQDGFATESEVVAEWYAQGQETLIAAENAKLLTHEEYIAAKLALDEQYNSKVAAMNDAASQHEIDMKRKTVDAVIGLVSAMGSRSEKLAKVAVALNAAKAIAETIQNTAAASVRALVELGPIAGPPAAARIKMYGAAQVGIIGANAALSMGSRGGGGGGSAGAGSSATATPAQQPATTFAFTLQNDPMGFGESFARQLIDQLNSTQRNGGQIRGVMA